MSVLLSFVQHQPEKTQRHCKEHEVGDGVGHHTRNKTVKNAVLLSGEDADVIFICLTRGKVAYQNPKLLTLCGSSLSKSCKRSA